MIQRLITFVLGALVCCACGTSSSTSTENDSTAVTAAAPVELTKTFCNWTELGVRDAAGDKAKYLTTIYLGEEVTLTADSAMVGENLWNKVTLSDGQAGWVRADFLAKKKLPAALVKTTKIYKRPDIATITDHDLLATEFVAADKPVNGWVHVRTKPLGEKWFREGYVQESSLLFADRETKFASLYKRARETSDEKVSNAIYSQLDEYRGVSELYAQVYEVDDEAEEGYVEEETDPAAMPEGPPYSIDDIADLNDMSGERKIVNIYGKSEYWYIYDNRRYLLSETRAETIVQVAFFWHCTEEYLNSIPATDRVLDVIPTSPDFVP